MVKLCLRIIFSFFTTNALNGCAFTADEVSANEQSDVPNDGYAHPFSAFVVKKKKCAAVQYIRYIRCNRDITCRKDKIFRDIILRPV